MRDTTTKPIPQLRGEERPFFAAAAEGRLAIQRCPECGHYVFFPRTVCPRCHRGGPEWIDAAGTGTLFSFSAVARSAIPGYADEVPYVVALVELDEGVKLMANIVNVAPDEVRIGMRVRATFERCRDGATNYELRVVLTRDETVVLTDAFLLYGGGIEPGELWVLATSPDGAEAYATLRMSPDGYHLGEPAVDDGSHILFLTGLRLPKSPEFDPGPIDDGAFPAARESFCVDAVGAVIGYGFACP